MAEQRILVFGAHPDDEVLGAGATIASLARGGSPVRIVILGEGETSRDATHSEEGVQELRTAAELAAKTLGAESLRHHSLPDQKFDTIPFLDIVRLVEREIAEFLPDLVFTHFAGDLNLDHELTCRAVLTATRPVGGHTPDVLSYEVRSSTDWSDVLSGPAFQPNVWFEADDESVAIKQSALRCYDREMRPWPHSRSHEAVSVLLKHRGAQTGVSAAEAFILLRSLRKTR